MNATSDQASDSRQDWVAIGPMLWRRRVPILSACLAVAIATFIYTTLQPRQYTADVALIPVARLDATGQSGLDPRLLGAARQFGLRGLGRELDVGNLLPEILGSRRLQQELLDAPLVRTPADTVTLHEILRGDRRETPLVREKILERLGNRVLGFRQDPASGVGRVRITLNDPGLAAVAVERCVAILNQTLKSILSAQATEQVRFVSERLEDVGDGLHESEEALVAFRESNKAALGSPQLRQQEERLMRDVQLNEQLFITLKTQLELARIEQVRSTSVLAEIDPATVPAMPRPRRRVLKTATAFLATAGLLTFLIFLVDAPRRRD